MLLRRPRQSRARACSCDRREVARDGQAAAHSFVAGSRRLRIAAVVNARAARCAVLSRGTQTVCTRMTSSTRRPLHGENLGGQTSRLLQLLDCYGAVELDRAIAEAITRGADPRVLHVTQRWLCGSPG
jgi:hypothetical protein